jgi:uncharacterized membrane protein YraQ (UPF0718 family)
MRSGREAAVSGILDLTSAVGSDFRRTIQVNWPYLLMAVVLATVLRTYVGTDRIQSALSGRAWLTVPMAVLVASFTPFCSCGTEAVVLGLMAGAVPWAPIIAFMVSSPLTSPEELLLSAGLFGWPFALTYFIGAAILGLAAGAATAAIERRGWLVGQARMTVDGLTDGQLPYEPIPVPAPRPHLSERLRLRALRANLLAIARRIAIFFSLFVLLGYLIIELLPQELFETYLGAGAAGAIPAAAVLGVPFYVNTEGSLPLVASLVEAGMSQGAAMAFLVTGAGTSIGAIAGALVIARSRVVALVVGTLMVGALGLGYLTAAIL